MTAREARGECVFMCVLWGGSVMVWDEMGSAVIFRRWNQNNMGTGTQFGIRLLTVISIKTHNPVTQYHYCWPDKLLSSEITSWCGNTSGRGQGAGGPGAWGGGPHTEMIHDREWLTSLSWRGCFPRILVQMKAANFSSSLRPSYSIFTVFMKGVCIWSECFILCAELILDSFVLKLRAISDSNSNSDFVTKSDCFCRSDPAHDQINHGLKCGTTQSQKPSDIRKIKHQS